MFYTLYPLLFELAYGLARLVAPLSSKIKQFLAQRSSIASDIQHFKKEDGQAVFWFHTASMGEFEQIKPLLEEIKTSFPKAQTVVC